MAGAAAQQAQEADEMRAPLVLAAIAAMILIPTIAVFSAEVSDGSSAMGDDAGAINPSDVDDFVLCLSGTGQSRLAVGPGDTVRSVAASVEWLIVADGTVTYALDAEAPRSLTVSGAATLRETLAIGETHSIVWTLPGGGIQEFNLKVGAATLSWTETGTIDEGTWRSAAWLDAHDRDLVLSAAGAALVCCGCIVAYYLARKSETVGDVI